VNQVVNAPPAAATSTSLTSTPNPSTVGQAVTLSSTVTSGAGVPTGTVTFRDGATVLGTVTLVNGSASLSISTLAAGTHPLPAALPRRLPELIRSLRSTAAVRVSSAAPRRR